MDEREGRAHDGKMGRIRDVVVTVPKSFGLAAWIAEGDAAGEPWSGQEWHFYLGGHPPRMQPGDRVYVVYNNVVRGYAPLVRIDRRFGEGFDGRYALVRHGGAVAVTIPEIVRGFRGWRYRWWRYEDEMPFPDWRDPDAPWKPPWRASVSLPLTPDLALS